MGKIETLGPDVGVPVGPTVTPQDAMIELGRMLDLVFELALNPSMPQMSVDERVARYHAHRTMFERILEVGAAQMTQEGSDATGTR